ncbi:MAG: mechanosensitive ion channel family protein [Planctomycetes bacterium]|nr:mechanosensitive ion channel family protein [Planctomycetota bacterium]
MLLRCQVWLSRCLRVAFYCLPLLLVVLSSRLSAQETSETPVNDGQQLVVGRADTSSPRATIKSFLDACDEIYELVKQERFLDPDIPSHRALAMRIVDCLDTSQLPEYSRFQRAGEAAVCLKEILDRVELPSGEEVPDVKAIESSGEGEKAYRWRVPGTRISIARVEQGPQRHEYLFSPGTVERAADYYQDMRHLPYRKHGPKVTPGFYHWYISAPRDPVIASILEYLPDWTRNQKFGITLWKLPALLISLALAIALMATIYVLQRRIAARFRQRGLIFYCLSIMFPLAAILVPIGLKTLAIDYIALRGKPLYAVSFAADFVVLLAMAVVVFGISNRVAEIIISSPRIHPRGLDAQLIRILTKLASLAGVAVIFLEGGKYLGVPLTTLLASAGVGGLAVALAAQDTLKALFGTITLMADKPFRVGERIVFNKYDGVVEDIGLRSTRLRLLTGNQATVPNDELARADIENVGRRPHIRRVADIRVPLDTKLERLEEAVEAIRKVLENHEGFKPEFPPRVFFNEFNDDSFNLRVMYWYHPADYWKFLDFSQRLNLQICGEFESRGISFLLPSRITYSAESPSRR